MAQSNKKVPAAKTVANHHPHPCCPSIREVLSRVGDKWSMLIVGILSQEALRFNELKRRVDGISQRMLTLTLRELERDGLVSRTVTPVMPPSVEYALTGLGHTLLEPVSELIDWTMKNYPQIEKARKVFDNRKG